MKSKGITRYKLKRIAVESLRNALRLHFDSIVMYENGYFPTAFQLSVLSLEEFWKALWVEHFMWTSETNNGYPDEKFEQEWLQLLYKHPAKQEAFIARDLFDFSPKFAKFIEERKLEEKKQNATYVGLARVKGKVDITSRISTPLRIGSRDAKQMISLLNSEFLYVCRRIEEDEFHFDLQGMDEVFDYQIFRRLLKWPFKSKIKGPGWYKKWRAVRN